jgi:2-keto-4-pentenoate hydratase/2-oxohepta-3-ene-1,7-dioic acid hydratase in catechol pathway
MRIANLAGRAVLLDGDVAYDIAAVSNGAFGPSPRTIFDDWAAFRAWAASAHLNGGSPFDRKDLEAPVPDPRQIFAIGLNYRDHADEAGLAYPEDLVVFTKFVSSLSGPNATVRLPSDHVDYETELVVVLGREVHDVDESEACRAIAGYAVGQDLSERVVQFRGPAPQFSLAKSFAGFSPFGPAVVTLDELPDPAALRIGATITGPTAQAQGAETFVLQDGTTADLIFSVERIISDLSRVVTLYPGDLIFTGTPAGVGGSRGIFLMEGDELVSSIEGVGTITNRFTRGKERPWKR